MSIAFGTSGWRAIIAEEFTLANVRLVTSAIASVLQDETAGGSVIIGYDTRFLSERFAAECGAEFAELGFESYLTTRDTPTPTLSHAIRTKGARGGINFTASHNPPQYNGMKFSTADGAPALPEVTKKIEERIAEFQSGRAGKPERKVSAEAFTLDPREDYLNDLGARVDFAKIASAGLKIGYDPLWGTGRGYLDEVLRRHECEVSAVHDYRDVLFGGHSPEPSEKNLSELRGLVLDKGLALGVSTDGDADRFGFIDRDGSFVSANYILALILDYLCETRPGWTGGVARSVATTHLLDRVAKRRGRQIYETPVGFKFIGELVNQDKIIMGGEESAGLTVKGHFPEKDGILACLLVTEMVASRGASLGEMLEELFRKDGALYSERVGIKLTPEVKDRLQKRLSSDPPASIGGRRVAEVNRMDGVKYIFDDGSWILLRMSGTEPLVRCYAETNTKKDLEVLIETGSKFILS
ncbi:MAG TPA: phosphoglucomutase/phosphomannomutase family protein [Blastocatellia bacterium]|nr:phosphoglucomutase/phosphomannomutase family protein [Blastocatellia bacterium]